MKTPKTRIHISLPDDLDDSIRARVTAGKVRSVSKYIAMAVAEKLQRDGQVAK